LDSFNENIVAVDGEKTSRVKWHRVNWFWLNLYRYSDKKQTFVNMNSKGTPDTYSIALKKEKPSGKR